MRFLSKVKSKPHGILLKMMLRSVFMISLTILFVEFVSTKLSSDTIKDLTHSLQRNMLNTHALIVDRKIGELITDLKSLSEMGAIHDYIENNRYGLMAESNQNLSAIREAFITLQARKPEILALYFQKAGHPTLGSDQKMRDWKKIYSYTSPDQTQPKYMSYSIKEFQEKKALSYIRKIRNDYQIEILYDFSYLLSEIKKSKIYETGYIAVLSEIDGSVLFHPNYQIGEKLKGKNVNSFLQDYTNEHYQDEQEEASYFKKRTELNNWVLISTVQHEEMYASLERIKKIVTTLVIGMVLFELAFLYIILNQLLLKPIESIRNTIKRVAQGDLTAIVSISKKDEIGEIAEYLNKMILALKEKREELLHKNVKLQKTIEAKSQFLANMSHEIRTPLNGIIGIVDILRQEDISDEMKQHLSTVAHSGDLLLSIINDILEFSKIEAGKLQLEHRSFHLHECIHKLGDVMANQAFRKNLEFIINISDEVPIEFIGDEVRLKQLLLNLVGNAIKFTPEGFIEIRVFYQEIDWLVLEVLDSGVGIPKNKIQEIFSAFSQVDNSDTRKYGGTGLGLSISKSIVEAMSGSLEVKSEEAKGTVFKIMIPMTVNKVDLVQRSNLKPIMQNEKVLIIAASAKLRDYLDQQLSAHGIQVFIQETAGKIIDFREEVGSLILDDRVLRKLNDEDLRSLLKICHDKGIYIIPLLEAPLSAELKILFQDNRYHPAWKPVRNSLLLDLLRTKKTIVKIDAIKTEGINKENTKTNRQKILVVEDTPANQKVAGLMLTAAGFDFKIAENGKKAVEFVLSEEFDLILMDCQMPIMDGYEATKQIRELELKGKKRIPIIAMTANAFRETKERCFECGMDSFITKPVKLNDLVRIIEEVKFRRSA